MFSLEANISIRWSIRLAAGFVVLTFLLLISLSVHMLNGIPRMDRTRSEGFQITTAYWLGFGITLAQTEQQQHAFLATTPGAEMLQRMETLLTNLSLRADAIQDGEDATVSQKIQEYSATLSRMVQTLRDRDISLEIFKKNHETLEIRIYDMEDQAMENTLNELNLAQLGYLLQPSLPRLGAVSNALDQLENPDCGCVFERVGDTFETAFRSEVADYRQTLQAIAAHNTAIEQHSVHMQQLATKIHQRVQEAQQSMVAAAKIAEQARSETADQIGKTMTILLFGGGVYALAILWIFILCERFLQRLSAPLCSRDR